MHDGHGIQRLALLYDENLTEDEIIDDHPEYSGVQLLRGNQWIETRGSRAEYGDLIPRDKRPGFRGFVEFFRDTDAELRKTENSQHDGFDGRTKLFRDLRQALLGKVGEFSSYMGWEQQGDETPKEVSQREKRVHAQFLQTFTQPKQKKKPSPELGPDGLKVLWDCRLDLDFPDANSARVDWGQEIRSVYIEVSAEPAEEIFSSGSVFLEWVDHNGKRCEIWRKEADFMQESLHGRITLPFDAGDWQVIGGEARRPQHISCPVAGIHRLRAVVEYKGERVKGSTRTIYVQMEPPPPPEMQPIALSISPTNESDSDQKRIEHGQVLLLQINAKNRKTIAERVYLNARIDKELLAKNLLVELPATPAGDTSQPIPALLERRRLLDPVQTDGKWEDDIVSLVMEESSYRSKVRAELLDSQGNYVVKPISQTIYFQLDPGKSKSNLPFEINQRPSSSQAPMWELNEALDELSYPGNYPIWEALPVVQRQRRPLQGRDAFTAEICANGLLEWALRPLLEGDESNFGQLMDAMWEKDGNAEDDLWERYQIRLENLAIQASNSTHIEFSKVWRETVSVMLEIFRQEAV